MAFATDKVRAAGKVIAKGLLSARDALRHLLFDRQRELYDAVLNHRQAAALAGRRSGKTSTLIVLICLCAGHFGWGVVLVYPDARQARAKVIGKLTRLARLLGLSVHTRMSDGIVEIGKGTLEIGSAHTRAAIDSIRGDGAHLAIIDEPASIADDLLEYLMDEVIGPSLMDHFGHWLMTGTPTDVPGVGRWWTVTDGPVSDNPDAVWNVIRDWNYTHNPELRDPERTIDAELARRGITRDSDTFQREYLAQYVAADAIRPLHWTIANDYDQLPADLAGRPLTPVMKVLGIDIGFTDEDAEGVLYVYRGAIYLVEEDIAPGQTDPQLATMTRGMIARHRPDIVTADSANAKTIATLQADGLPVTGAKKGRGSVPFGLKQLDSLLREVRFFAKRDSRFVKDAAIIRWKEPGKTLRKTPHSNIIPAVRYALDEVPAPLLLPAPPPVAPTIFENPILRALLRPQNPDTPDYR